MLDCREVRTDFNCESCYEITIDNCSAPININPGLDPNEVYYLNLFDQFDLKRTIQFTSNTDGSFDIELGLLPDNYFNPFGAYDFNITTDQNGSNKVALTFYGEEYECVILFVSESCSHFYVNLGYVECGYVE